MVPRCDKSTFFVNKNGPCSLCRIVGIGTLDDDSAFVLGSKIELLLVDAVSIESEPLLDGTVVTESELLLAGTVVAELLEKKLVNDT